MWGPQQTVVAKLMNRLQNKETTVEFSLNGTVKTLYFLEDDAWVDTVNYNFVNIRNQSLFCETDPSSNWNLVKTDLCILQNALQTETLCRF